jgi:hypothetical protein
MLLDQEDAMATTTRARGRRFAVGLVALPLVLAACGSQHVGAGSGSGAAADGLPLLHVGVRDGAAAAMEGTGGAADDPYPVVGVLPAGPKTAVVYRFSTGATPDDTAVALAAALHLAGSPVRHDHGWSVAAGGAELRVRDDGSWSFWRSDATCPYRVDVDTADNSQTAVGCAAPIPGAKDSVTDAEALAAAVPVLTASGATGTPSVNRADLVRVSASRVVDDLQVSGGDTSVTVDRDGVVDATGITGTPAAGPAYPIITAAQALDVLRAQPKPAIACVAGATCPGVGPEHVTGAVLGLVPGDDDGTSVLLPAWLFTVKEQSTPIAVMAVQDQFLAQPSTGVDGNPSAVAGSSGGSTGSGGGSVGSSPEPVPPATDQPAPASPTSGPAARPVTIDRATLNADGRTLTLWGEGGLCADYTAVAKEDADHVYAVLTSTPSQDGKICPAMAKQVSASVTLQDPLGARTVLDAGIASMPTVPVARS